MKKLLLSLGAALMAMSASAFSVSGGDTFELVTNSDELNTTDTYILCYESNVMGTQNGKFRNAVIGGITLNGNTATVEADKADQIVAFKLVNGTSSEYYAFNVGDESTPSYLNCTSNANNSLAVANSILETCNITITITDGVAKIPFVAKADATNVNLFQCNTNSGQERFSNYKTGTQKNCSIYKYVENTPTDVANPVINVEQGSSQYTVTMTCATDGAEIYYTTDGVTDPTSSSTKYTEPIVLKSLDNTTFKAIAIVGDDQSNVVTRTVAVPLLTTELSAVIEAMTALGKNETVDFVYTGKLTYVYKGISGNNAYLYLTDGTDNVLLFGFSNIMTDYVEGTTYTSLAGTGQNYNGLPEVTNFTLGGLATGAAAVQPVVITSIKDNIDEDHMNAYYEISNVSIQGTTMTDSEGNEITLYNRFNITIPEANKLLVRGFVAAYNNVQFYPTYIESMAQVFNPEFSLEDGEYADGTVVTISCATEGATIVYTINDGDVIEAPAPVKIILTEDVTIEAYATKEGLEDSDVVEATYTVKKYEIEGNSATFEFSTEAFQTSWVEPLDEAFVYPNENVLNFDGKYVFINNGVQLSFSKGSNSNNGTCLYTSGNGQLRDYTGNQIIVSILSSAYYISNVTFVHGTSNYGGFTTEQGSMNSDKDSWTATDKNTNSITFTVAANNRIDGINVEFEAIDTAVEGINADEVAPVYYNLQGVKVANPEKGIYIVVKGDKTSKVIF